MFAVDSVWTSFMRGLEGVAGWVSAQQHVCQLPYPKNERFAKPKRMEVNKFMSRIRLLLLGLLAVLAVGVVASASASADSCSGGTSLVFCSGSEALVGKEVLGTSGAAVLAGTTGGAEIKISCTSDDFKATLGALGASKGLILFLKCVQEKPAGCDLSAAQAKEIDAKFTAAQRSTTLSLFTGEGAGSEFVSLEITNLGTCAIPTGSYPVAGKQLVETPEGEVSKTEHEIIAKKAGSFLTFDGHPASFSSSTTNAHLASGSWFVTASGQ
jgi:hypothetical protein